MTNKLARTVTTLHDLHEFVSLLDALGWPDDAEVFARIRVSGRVRELWVTTEGNTSATAAPVEPRPLLTGTKRV